MRPKTIVAVSLIIITSAFAIIKWLELARLKEEFRKFRETSNGIQVSLEAERNRLSEKARTMEGSRAISRKEVRDLARLRNEVGLLRNQLALRDAELAKLKATSLSEDKLQVSEVQKQERKLGGAKMNFVSDWLMAIQKQMQDNNGALPADPGNVSGRSAQVSEESRTFGINSDDYELFPDALTSKHDKPENVIVVRERQIRQESDGAWVRGYGFADGHSELHREMDILDFPKFELKHELAAPQ